MWIVGLLTASHARASSSAFALSGLNYLTGPDQIFIFFFLLAQTGPEFPKTKERI